MKKVMMTLSAFALVAMFAACGGSPESKAEDFHKKACECAKIEDQAKQKECLDNLKKEVDAYEKELKGEDSTKYAAKAKELAEKECEK